MPFTLTVLTYSVFLFVASRTHAAAVTAVPYTDCSIESGRPCGGIVYAPATWCQNNLAQALYSTVANATGTAACSFTASPTAITLGVQSTYHPTDVPSCVSGFSGTQASSVTKASAATAASSTTGVLSAITASSATAASSTTGVLSAMAASSATAASSDTTASSATLASSSSTISSSPSLNIQPTSTAADTVTAAAPAAPIHTANCTMVFQPAGWPQTTTIPSMPTGLVFSMYNSYGRDISPGPGASCTDAPASCNFDSSGYPKSNKFATFDSELPYPFGWAIADVAGDTVFYYNYHSPDVASTVNERGSWDLSALDWSQQQNFTWDCSAPKRVHQSCNATTSFPLDKQDGGDTIYDVDINILDPNGNNVGGTTLDVHQPSDNDYKNHKNMQFFPFWTPLITLLIGWDVTDGGGHAAFYFAYGENDYQTDGLGTVDKKAGVQTTNTVFDCYYDELDKPWLGP